MAATTFINTKAEAKIALEIAHEYGFTSLTVDRMYKNYTSTVFSVWSGDKDAHQAQEDIRFAIIARRKDIAESRASRDPKRIAAERQAERELVAHNISARTGEPYNDVLKRV